MGFLDFRNKFQFKPKHLLAPLSAVCIALIVLTAINAKFGSPFKTVASAVIVPMQKGINQVGLYFYDKAELLQSISTLQNKYDELSEDYDELRLENTMLIQQQAELERLRELYDLDNVYSDYEKIAAHIIAKDSSNWFTTFTIDKGSKDGIEENMNVIADGGLVGLVTYVGKNYATVTAIINDGVNVSAKLEKNSDLCIVEGDLTLYEDGLLAISNISSSAEVEAGDMVLTSYISEKFVPGILIGYVTSLKTDSDGLTQSGYITPAVDFEHLEEVLVITTLKETGDLEEEE